MSYWKVSKKYKALSIALAIGLVIANFVTIVQVFAADLTKGSAQVLSTTNQITPSTIVFNKLDPKDVEVMVATGTDLLAMKITNGKYVLTENDYILIDNKVTILSTYLIGLTTRSAKLKFDFAGGSDKYLKIALKNESAAISSKSVAFTNKSTKDVLVTVNANGLTLTGISYAGVNLPEDAYSEGPASSSGSVKVSIKASYLATLPNDKTKELLFYYSGRGTNPSIKLIVSGSRVSAVSSVRAVTVTTLVGIAPVLPVQVVANYTDSTSIAVDVTWDDIDASKYSEAGTFYVEGTITGTSIKANAIVTVTVTAEEAALNLVVKAEGSKSQADKDAALAAVNALESSDTKTNLLSRVNAIVVLPAETGFHIIDIS